MLKKRILIRLAVMLIVFSGCSSTLVMRTYNIKLNRYGSTRPIASKSWTVTSFTTSDNVRHPFMGVARPIGDGIGFYTPSLLQPLIYPLASIQNIEVEYPTIDNNGTGVFLLIPFVLIFGLGFMWLFAGLAA